MIALLLALALATPEADVKRARDRYEFGAYADAAGAVREMLSRSPDLPEPVAIEAWRILGLAEYQLGNKGAARAAFVQLLSIDPDQVFDPFLVPPPVVDFFDSVRAEAEPELAPLRERKKQVKEQERLADEARRRLLAEELIRSGPPSKIIIVQEHIYLLNFLPFGVGRGQDQGDEERDHRGGSSVCTAGTLMSWPARMRTKALAKGRPGSSSRRLPSPS